MKTACIVVLLSYAGVAVGWAMGLCIVTTPSVPRGVYRTHPVHSEQSLARGAFVCVRALSDYAPATLHDAVRDHGLPSTWIKVLAGLPGDVVTHSMDPDHVAVNGLELPHSATLPRDSSGHVLPHASYPVHLSPGQVWLTSLDARGYDSRYFGPVEMRAVSCIAEPVWTL